MKYLPVLLIGTLLGGKLWAQPCAHLNLGTKTLYPNLTGKPTQPPVGYQPVFINHAGRHGARHLTKPVSDNAAYKLLQQAGKNNNLSDEGKKLFHFLQQLDTVEGKNIKSISARGMQEQAGIARRMYQNYPALFRQKGWAGQVQVTKEIRTRQTAEAFTGAMQQAAAITDPISYTINDTTLRFYDLAPAYLQFEDSGSWKKDLQQIRDRNRASQVADAVVNRLFTSPFATALPQAEKESFVAELYGFYTILPSVQEEAAAAHIQLTADSLQAFFTCAGLQALGAIDRAEDYLSKGPGTNDNGVQVKIAAPLLADFITTTDAALQNGKPTVQLRFCHAETIAPFAALLELTGAAKAITNTGQFSDAVWNAATVVPLSANVQWVLYKGRNADDYLVKLLLNEREVGINGLATKQYPFYKWKDVRAYYLAKLAKMHLGLVDNKYRYLQQLQ
jgi:multiple inositol-polyphosphate phosphatase / 2,3-bisphosphoglycerate 3-phosphatase